MAEEEEKRESLSKLIEGKSPDEAAELVLFLVEKHDFRVLDLCNDELPDAALNDTLCQHIAERALKDVVDMLKSKPITDRHLFSGALLVGIKDIRVVKKYLWKDKMLIQALVELLRFSKIATDAYLLLRDIAVHLLQTLLLGGPNSLFNIIYESDLIILLAEVLKFKLKVVSFFTYEEILLSLIIICQNHQGCVKKCHELKLQDVLLDFSKWSELDSNMKEKAEVASNCINHMVNLEELPDHKKLLLSKFTHHMNTTNKTCKVLETVICSNPVCGKRQPDEREKKFKKCGRCRINLYCSRNCQVTHWRSGHSKICSPPTD